MKDEQEPEEDNGKNSHAGETSSHFFEPDFSVNQVAGGDPILSDSLRIEEVVEENEEAGNGS